MAPDTLIVITRSAESSIDTRNLVPAGVAFLAAVIAGASAWWGTRNQTRVSEKGIEAQEAISKAALVAQRELAEDGAIRQAELGRLDRVVQSRREWMNKLRDAVSEYEGQASYVYDWTAHH